MSIPGGKTSDLDSTESMKETVSQTLYFEECSNT